MTFKTVICLWKCYTLFSFKLLYVLFIFIITNLTFNKIILIYIIVIIYNTVYYGLLKVFIMQSAFKLIFIIIFRINYKYNQNVVFEIISNQHDFMDNVNLDLEILGFHIPTYFLFNKTYYITFTICEKLFVSYVYCKSSADKMSQ